MGSCKNLTVSGCLLKNSGTASCAFGPVAACRNSKNSAPVRVGKYLVECAIMSVCWRLPSTSGRWNRIAIPRGLAFASVSGIFGRPVEEENRTVIGVVEAFKWGALLRADAECVGTKTPLRRCPLAWAGGHQIALMSL